MSARSRERIAADESTVIAELSLGVCTVEGLEGNGSFPNPPGLIRAMGSKPTTVPTTSSISSGARNRPLAAGEAILREEHYIIVRLWTSGVWSLNLPGLNLGDDQRPGV